MPIVSSKLFQEAGNFKDSLAILAVCQSHFFLCPTEYLADSFIKQEPWRTTSPLDMFSSHFSVDFACTYSIASSSPGKNRFLPKWLANSTRSLFNANHPLEKDCSCHEHMCLIFIKSPEFLKHFKCYNVKISERFEEHHFNWNISLYI